MGHFTERLAEASAGSEPFALGLITSIRGSSPQKTGAKALFFTDGRIVGTMGGGCLEAEIQDRARRALRTGEAATFDLVLDHDFGWDDGLICGGKVSGLILPRAAEARAAWETLALRERERKWGVRKDFTIALRETDLEGAWLYEETIRPQCELRIAGSGHVAQAVARLAEPLDFRVTVLDDRSTFANREFFPTSTRFRTGSWDDLLAERLDERVTFGLIVTRGHQRDALVLAEWITQPFAFLGMIGSSRKKRLIFDQLMADGVATEAMLAGVRCPVGLEIGSVTVPEIAVSIAAQLVQERAVVLAGDGTRAGPS